MKHRRLILILLLLLIFPVADIASARQTGAITVSVSAGYDGYFQRGQWIPIRVAVENAGGDFDGVVRVRTGGASGLGETTYRTPLNLPRGARKQVFLYVSLGNFAQRIQVEIVDRRDRVVARADAQLTTIKRGDIMAVVVTNSAFGSVDLTARTPGTGDAYQANWQIEDIPPMAEALAGIDVLLLYDIDTGTLDAEQTAAITRWALGGGHLIVAGGEAWQRTTTAFVDVLPVTPSGTVTLESLMVLGGYLEAPSDDLQGDVVITTGTINGPARVLVSDGDVPLIVRRTYGSGTIDFLAFDPNAGPLRVWQDSDQLWYILTASTGQRPSWTDGFTSWSMGRDATVTTSNTVLPTFLQLCGFLLVYIVLIGPVNYLILRRLNCREWAWFTIPILIIGFSALAYSVGFNLRGTTATLNRLTVIRSWADAEEGQALMLLGVQSPRRTDYDVEMERGFTLRTLPDIGTGLGVPSTISEGTRYTAEDVPIDAGTIASFTASGYANVEALNARAVWHLRDGLPPLLEIRITNRTNRTFEDVVVLLKGESRYLGDIDLGWSRSIEIEIGPQDAGPLTLGNPLNQANLYYAPVSWGYTSGPGWCFSYEGIDLTMVDVMRNEPFSCSSNEISERRQELRRRYRLLGSLVVDTDLSGGRGTGVYLFGWTTDAIVDVQLVGRPQHEEDTTLHIFELPVSVVADNRIVEVPPSLTTWTIIEADDPNTVEVSPIHFRVSTLNQAAFQFMPMPSVRLEAVDELVMHYQGQGLIEIELWNWDLHAWVMITPEPDTDMTSIYAGFLYRAGKRRQCASDDK